jgi:hypothetical protein
VSWLWTAVVVWVLLAASAAVLLGRCIDRAKRREIGTAGPDTRVAPAHPSSPPLVVHTGVTAPSGVPAT